MSSGVAARRAGRWPARFALVLASTALSCALAELGLRAFGVPPYPDWSPPGLHVADPSLGLVPAPSADVLQEGAEFRARIHTDATGLRSGPRPREAAPVVLLAGDSFAFGHGVGDDDVVSAVLQDGLRASGCVRAWVANAGVSSYGTAQAEERVRRVGAEVRPDLCVLLFFEGNDPFDDRREPLTVNQGYVVRRGEQVSWWRRVQLAVKRHSSIYRVLVDALAPRPELEVIAGDHPAYGFDLFRASPPPASVAALAATDRGLAAFRDACDALGAPGLVAIVPTRYRADPAWWHRHTTRFGFQADDFELDRVADHVRARCAALGLHAIDLIDDVTRREGEPPAYFDRTIQEVHWNREGHARAGRRLTAEALALLGPCR